MRSQLNGLAFWVGGILLVIPISIFYQPASAKTGTLLIWQDGRIYTLDIDSLERKLIGDAGSEAALAPSPGCLGQVKAPCWVAVGAMLYPVGSDNPPIAIPLDDNTQWLDSPVSWSPDGLELAYTVFLLGKDQPELRVFNVASSQIKTLAAGVDSAVAVAWTAGCAAGLAAPTCRLAYKAANPPEDGPQPLAHLLVPAWADELRPANFNQPLLQLVSLTPLTGEQKLWLVPATKIFELTWTSDDVLLYSQPRHYFHRAPDLTPAYQMSPGSQLADMSPDGRYTVYYEPFTRKECQTERPKGGCWYLGVWLAESGQANSQRRLVYSRELTQAGEGHLNADPFWSPRGDAFVLFREGKLVHYNVKYGGAAAWYQGLWGQLTSAPVFSPNEEAVAFVYRQDTSPAQYHLLVLNPEFKPLEHIIAAQEGVRLLGWLPHQ